jgi:DNA-binding NtrC family response regulator
MGKILVLEDETLIALDLEMNLQELGVKEVFLARSVDQALGILSSFAIDFAIIDFNLGIETAEPVLEQLEEGKIPFVVMTGYPDHSFLGDGTKAWPMLGKPATMPALRNALAAMRGGAPA